MIDTRTRAEREAARPPHGLVARLRVFFAKEVWREDRVQSKDPLWRWCRVGYLATRGFFEDNCLFRASALTYITVLSLVPLLAFSFSVAKGFGFYKTLRRETIDPFLDQTFGPLQPEGGVEGMRGVLDKVLGFVERTKVSTLGVFGFLLLLYTVIRLLGTIERSFNDIWGVHRSRSIVRKISDYLAIVVVTPIFLFVAAGLTTAVETSFVVEFLRERLGMGGVIETILKLAPLFSLWLGFTFVYMTLPNTRTRLRSAILGAIVAGTLWQITLILHIKFQIGVARYNAIYSSFAALPVFLIWVNLSWVIVLLGAEICFAHQSEPSYVEVAQSRPSDHAFKELLGLRAMTRIGQRFLEGKPPRTAAGLAQEMAVPLRALQEVLDMLVDRGLLAETRVANEPALLPTRDLGSITVKAVLDALAGKGGPVDVPARALVDEQIDRLVAQLDAERESSRFNCSIRSLAEDALREQAASSVLPEHPAEVPSTARASAT